MVSSRKSMPNHRQKPSDIAVEAKRQYIPYIAQRYQQYPPHSFLHTEARPIPTASASSRDSASHRLRVAVIEGDPVDVALDWYDCELNQKEVGGSPRSNRLHRIPVVNMANEKRPGGDWELGLLAPEEDLCRRSNLIHCLTTPWADGNGGNYPIPVHGGIYSPHVVVFRSGPDKAYAVWPEFKSVPVISVAPIRRPKLDESGQRYSFAQEKELMKDKIRTVLRIANEWHHSDICVGAFGAGPSFKNPVRQLASMWKEILFYEEEFQDAFTNVVFAIEPGSANTGSSKGTPSDVDIFRLEFDPATIWPAGHEIRVNRGSPP